MGWFEIHLAARTGLKIHTGKNSAWRNNLMVVNGSGSCRGNSHSFNADRNIFFSSFITHILAFADIYSKLQDFCVSKEISLRQVEVCCTDNTVDWKLSIYVWDLRKQAFPRKPKKQMAPKNSLIIARHELLEQSWHCSVSMEDVSRLQFGWEQLQTWL